MCVGLRNAFMCYNSQLRTIYDMYAAKSAPWYCPGTYASHLAERMSYGLLSCHVWQLVLDAGLADEEMPMAVVCQALHKACEPASSVLRRRRCVLRSEDAAGVWTLSVPLYSPFLVRWLCCLQAVGVLHCPPSVAF